MAMYLWLCMAMYGYVFMAMYEHLWLYMHVWLCECECECVGVFVSRKQVVESPVFLVETETSCILEEGTSA